LTEQTKFGRNQQIPLAQNLVLGVLVTAKVSFHLPVLTAHQKAYQQAKDEPDNQSKCDSCHDDSFVLGYILRIR
jgi:hypothetical protein